MRQKNVKLESGKTLPSKSGKENTLIAAFIRGDLLFSNAQNEHTQRHNIEAEILDVIEQELLELAEKALETSSALLAFAKKEEWEALEQGELDRQQTLQALSHALDAHANVLSPAGAATIERAVLSIKGIDQEILERSSEARNSSARDASQAKKASKANKLYKSITNG